MAAGSKILHSEVKIIVRQLVDQLLANFDAPDRIGATSQWYFKLVAAYPCLADEGSDLYQKTASLRKSIRDRITYLRKNQQMATIQECPVEQSTPEKINNDQASEESFDFESAIL